MATGAPLGSTPLGGEPRRRKFNPSHRGFYPQFFKGLRCAALGISDAFSSPELRAMCARALPSTWYVLLFALLLCAIMLTPAYIREPLGLRHPLKAVESLGRTAYYAMLLGHSPQTRRFDEAFVAALRLRNPRFAHFVQSAPRGPKRSLGERIRIGAPRVARIVGFRLAKRVVRRFTPPSTQTVLLPTLRALSLKPALGTAVATSVAVATYFPFDGTYVDDVVVTLGEIVLDAYALGKDLLSTYARGVLDAQQRAYVYKRYSGYIIGMGALFGVLSRVPLLLFAAVLVGRCAAAELTLRIVGINQSKRPRIALPGEDVVLRIDTQNVGDELGDDDDDDDNGNSNDAKTR